MKIDVIIIGKSKPAGILWIFSKLIHINLLKLHILIRMELDNSSIWGEYELEVKVNQNKYNESKSASSFSLHFLILIGFLKNQTQEWIKAKVFNEWISNDDKELYVFH